MSTATTITGGAEEEAERDPEGVRRKVDSEANDLRELNLSATFLTPYSVTPDQNNHVWRSRAQEDYIDHTKQGAGNIMTPIVKKRPDMAAVIGFQGEASGKMVTETREKYSYSQHLADYVEKRDKMFFRTKDQFSEYVEARARDPSRSKK